MLKSICELALTTCLLIIFTGIATAQKYNRNPIQRAKLPEHSYLTGFPSSKMSDASSDEKEVQNHELSIQKKDLLRKINAIYKIHGRALQAEIDNDPLDAEKNIMEGLRAVQRLMKDNPGVRKNRRFTELYRTVYTEYRSFYGIKRIQNQETGKIFKVQRELFNSDNKWTSGNYELPKNLRISKSKIPLIYNDKVNRHLEFFTSNKPKVMQRWIDRSHKYFPMMKRIFRQEGLPTELVHLSMIESGLNPYARSWASAVGMWQFIRSTASMYGLEINWWMDERRDPEKATRAAARFLKDLYGTWGNWYLAIANYNISPRGLKRAIRADGGKEDFWAAYPYLPRETQGYVPSFIATTIIDRNRKAFGFKGANSHRISTYSYDVAEVAPLMPLNKLAHAAGISTKRLKQYNPALLRWATPPGSKYPLKLPKGTKNKFVANYSHIPKDKRSKGVAVHRVRRGESLGSIAQHYGSTVRAIYGSNKGLTSLIHPGQRIIVPLAPGSSKKIALKEPSDHRKSHHAANKHKQNDRAHRGMTTVRYTVKRGDNIGYIAEWYDVRASQIRAWNHTSNTIHVGEHLKVYVPADKKSYYRRVNSFSSATKQKIEGEQHRGKNITQAYLAASGGKGELHYTVKRHDTLGKIARKFGVSVSDIKRANGLKGSRIYKGQKLKIRSKKKIAATKSTGRINSHQSGRAALTYTVKKGDNLGYIAEWYDVRASQIRAWNGTSNTIQVGEKLKVYVPRAKKDYYKRVNSLSLSKKQKIEGEQHRGKKGTKAYLADSGKNAVRHYTVKRHDTLIDIADRFNVSVRALKRANNLSGSRIYRGQKLKINTN